HIRHIMLDDLKVVEALVQEVANKRKEELAYYRDQKKILHTANRKFYHNLWNKLLWRLAFDYIRRRCNAEIEWAENAIQEIRNFKLYKHKKR
ncbi:hypothetical protein ACFLZG_02465, partial [Thermodesulfobacteriota bacterium]